MLSGKRIINCLNIYSKSKYPIIASLNKLKNHTRYLQKFQPSVAYTHNLANKETVIKNKVLPVNKFVLRTHTCGELRTNNVGEYVRLCGWVEFIRMKRFIVLRDSYGSTQIIIPENRKDLEQIITDLPYESVLSVEGKVIHRPKDEENKAMATGDIEIYPEVLSVLNRAMQQLPFLTRDYVKTNENTQMTYRYLSLRHPKVQKRLRMRSHVTTKMREYLINECDFVDVETPTLFRCTPGGAQEFVVPTKHPGQFYSLVQSPQQFKQLLMVGGIDRYFQIAKCYRHESIRHDRQPEFTQLDIEMSFVDRAGVMNLVENLLMYCWPKEMNPISIPFKRMTYENAMKLYGTDQPDLRIPYQIQELTDIKSSLLEQNAQLESEEKQGVYALVFPQKHGSLTNSVKGQLTKLKNDYYSSVKLTQLKIVGNSWQLQLKKLFPEHTEQNIKDKLNFQEGDALFLAFGNEHIAQELLGRLRIEFANVLEEKGESVRTPGYEIVWIIDFPLFLNETVGNIKKLISTHHPFTQPHSEDISYLTTNPTKVRSLHYDLVINGSEIGGGSIRIHDTYLQKHVLNLLNINESELKHILQALESGAPPHGGIALGLDRFFCTLYNDRSIKSVIAFPKSTEGRDLMSNSPTGISAAQKKLYHIEVTDD